MGTPAETPEEESERKPVISATIQKEVWESFKSLTAAKLIGANGKPMSASKHLEQLMKKANDELAGAASQATITVADLERQLSAQTKKRDEKADLLEKHGVLEALVDLTTDMGLDDAFAKKDEIKRKILDGIKAKTWRSEYADDDLLTLNMLIDAQAAIAELIPKIAEAQSSKMDKKEPNKKKALKPSKPEQNPVRDFLDTLLKAFENPDDPYVGDVREHWAENMTESQLQEWAQKNPLVKQILENPAVKEQLNKMLSRKEC